MTNDRTIWEFLWQDIVLAMALEKLPAPSAVPDVNKLTEYAVKVRDRIENQLKETVRPNGIRS